MHRYERHEKLQNFMVPIPVAGTWPEEQIDELFGSLLGNEFESMEADGRIEDRIAGDGFRVF